MSVLDDLVAAARARARLLAPGGPPPPPPGPSFADALRGRNRLKLIAEFKRASPSAGSIALHADPAEQARRYAAAGAVAVSVITEPTHFGGSWIDLETVARSSRLPVLMKDFVVHPAQVRIAAALGARAALLIARCLDDPSLRELAATCRECWLTPLVECHSEAEIDRALAIPDAVIGVNNRDLDTLAVDRRLAPRLLRCVPADRIAVAESGYETAEQAREVLGLADAVLVGTVLMRGGDPARFVQEVLG